MVNMVSEPIAPKFQCPGIVFWEGKCEHACWDVLILRVRRKRRLEIFVSMQEPKKLVALLDRTIKKSIQLVRVREKCIIMQGPKAGMSQGFAPIGDSRHVRLLTPVSLLILLYCVRSFGQISCSPLPFSFL